MMTQIQAQLQDRLEEFEVIGLENQLAADYEKAQKPYVEANYEIDTDSDWCGDLYRVWRNYKNHSCLIGTFYQKRGKWISNSYYHNQTYLNLDQSLSGTFRSNELAIRHIIFSFESCRI